MAEPTYTLLKFEELRGWAEDDHDAALSVFQSTCDLIHRPQWKPICELAPHATNGRAFFEALFQPVLIEDGKPMLFTGYFEPELEGSLEQGGPYQHPIYRVPDELPQGAAWHTRREIQEGNILAGRGLEIAWLKDPVDLFFLQVQGSGRVSLPNGDVIRVGYGGKNGHEYTSVGLEMVRRGLFEEHEVSADVIRAYVEENPELGQELLWVNNSYVFFREVNEVPAEKGPLGAMGRSVTPLRTLAVDPDITPLGAPVWIEKPGDTPLQRLMVAQDTGSAIKGAQRADIFFGTGDAAYTEAARVKDGGRMITLMPIQMAYGKTPPVVE